MTLAAPPRSFTTAQACAVAGTTYRKADYFSRVLKTAAGAGSGTSRSWTEGDVFALAALEELDDGPVRAQSLVRALVAATSAEEVADFAVKVGAGDWHLVDSDVGVLAILGTARDPVRVLRLWAIKQRMRGVSR